MIATRTPEGEPLNCAICGENSFVLVSSPSFDSVCPSCGAFAWIKAEQKLSPNFSQRDRAILPQLLECIRTSKTRNQVCRLLADGISLLLVPESIRVSTAERDDADRVVLMLQAQRGNEAKQAVNAEMLHRLRTTKEAVFRKSNGDNVFVLPMLRQDQSLAGVIEVEHKSCLPDYRVAEHIRVISSIGAVAIGTHLLD